VRNWSTDPASAKNKSKRKAVDSCNSGGQKRARHETLASGHVEIFTAEHLELLTGHTRESLIMTALLGGSDETIGVSGIGMKVAAGLVDYFSLMSINLIFLKNI
jgi:5'-3' exonuclease